MQGRTYMKPFSRLHFSSVRATTGPSFLKNKCCSGLQVVPGPLAAAYSRAFTSALS